MNTQLMQLDSFRQYLHLHNCDYLRLSCDADNKFVHIRFIGQFHDRDVIWDANLKALGDKDNSKQYIRIDEIEGDLMPITIGLAISQFRDADILKSIIMIRNYKRLHIGQHHWQAN